MTWANQGGDGLDLVSGSLGYGIRIGTEALVSGV